MRRKVQIDFKILPVLNPPDLAIIIGDQLRRSRSGDGKARELMSWSVSTRMV